MHTMVRAERHWGLSVLPEDSVVAQQGLCATLVLGVAILRGLEVPFESGQTDRPADIFGVSAADDPR